MRRSVAVAVAWLVLGGALAADTLAVPGSSNTYPAKVEATVAGKAVTLDATGTAMRTRFTFNVYAVASYVQPGSGVKSAEELAAADCAKRLHLIMERTVDGTDMAEAFRSAIRAAHPDPAFSDEIGQLVQYMKSSSARKGDHLMLTHVPGIGLQINVAGKAEFLIKNVEFSKAVWGIYLGKKCIGDAIKRGLVSRL